MPLELYAYFGVFADITSRCHILAKANQRIQVNAAALQVDPCPGKPKGVVICYSNSGALKDKLLTAGCPEGGSISLPSSARVALALYGTFVEVSDVLRDVAAGPVFSFTVSADAFGTDPLPGIPKACAVLVHGGEKNEDVRHIKKEGETIMVRWS